MAALPAPAPHRLGEPSPLVFHLQAALAAYQGALLAGPRASDSRFPWAAHLRDAAAGLGELDRIAVAREVGARLSAMLRGLELWQTHPYRRRVPEPPAIWSRGASRLLDFGQTPEARNPNGVPLLVVPSLINRSYILDLLPERSLLRWLSGRGIRPVLLDWGAPEGEEREFDIADYGERRLLPALDHLRAASGRPVPILGYCMGGTLAAGLAARSPERVAALVTIGAPWQFAATSGITGGLRAMVRAEGAERMEELIDGLGEAFGCVPVPTFQLLFALVNPMQAAVKFRRFANLDQTGAAARQFAAIEDWLTDGVVMARRAARDLLVGWQIRNCTARGRWRFLGGFVEPRRITAPTLAFCGQRDTIAPSPVSLPLVRAVPGARLLTPPTGHVGMVVGSSAPGQVWQPLAEFLEEHAG